MVFHIITFEMISVNSPYCYENTRSWHVLTSSPKISDLTKNDFFPLNLAQNDEKVGQRYFSTDFSSFQLKPTEEATLLQKEDQLNKENYCQ